MRASREAGRAGKSLTSLTIVTRLKIMERSQPARRLPPLNALRFFEAAGRLQSIRQAAAELYVTPGAVSRQVQGLESWLGVPLFDHGARSVSLTAAGARYLHAVTEHLEALAKATDDVTGRDLARPTLLIRSYTFFATNWLVPRLTEFRRLTSGDDNERESFCRAVYVKSTALAAVTLAARAGLAPLSASRPRSARTGR
jgi:hypothetical protein